MIKVRPIGGYFGLELPPKKSKFPNSDGLLVNSGRNALEVILESLPVGAEVLVPKYTCEVIFEPFVKTNTSYRLYDVDENLELPMLPHLSSNQWLLYTNYFGIKDKYVRLLSSCYRGQLIVDNSQALFNVPSNSCQAFYSPRKFIGVPDGGIISPHRPFKAAHDVSWDRTSHLLKRIDLGATSGYQDFKTNSQRLHNQPVKRMSLLTTAILESADWDEIKRTRRENFAILDNALGKLNLLDIPGTDTFDCPLVYPFRTASQSLRQDLISNEVFVATYWPNVLRDNKPGSTTYQLASSIIPLPIDQRYGSEDMTRIIKIVSK